MDSTQERQVYRVLFFLAALGGVGYVVFQVLESFFAALIWAVVLAVVFQRPWRALVGRLPHRRALAAALLTLAVALVVLLPASIFVGVLAAQAAETADDVVAALRHRNITSFSDVVAMPAAAQLVETLDRRLGISAERFERFGSTLVARAKEFLASFSEKMVLGVADALLTFATTLFLLFFFFLDGERISAAALELLPADDEGREELKHSLTSMVGAIFRGSLLLALVQGLCGGVGWWLAGLGSPSLAGASMAILSLLPLGGAAIVWLPGSVWAWYTGHHGAAIFLLVWGTLVISFLADNVLRPLLIRGAEGLSPIVVFLGVFGGLAAFGLLGIFIGPMALVVAVSLVDAMRRRAHGGHYHGVGESQVVPLSSAPRAAAAGATIVRP